MVREGKEERFTRVAEAVVAQLLRGSPQDLHYAAVARRAGVSRPWLYKYFGPDRDSLVEFTARLYGEAFARIEPFSPTDSPAVFRDRLADGTRRALADVVAAPWCVEFYFRFRYAEHVLGKAVREVERRHVEELTEALPRSLRRSPDAARRFAEVFTAARMAVYFRWLDPAFRARHLEDDVICEILSMFDGFARELA